MTTLPGACCLRWRRRRQRSSTCSGSARHTWGTHGSSSARLDSELLCAQALGLRRIDLYLQFDRPLDEQELTSIRELIRRRGKGEPVAYITGTREFYGRAVHRHARRARAPSRHRDARAARGGLSARPAGAELRVADLGTGSDASPSRSRPRFRPPRVVATDVSPAALEVAGANAIALGVDVELVELLVGDRLEGAFDLVVSNPPYRHHRGARGRRTGCARLRTPRGAARR